MLHVQLHTASWDREAYDARFCVWLACDVL